MIRRPLVWLLGAYLSGLILAWFSAAIWLILGMCFSSYVLLYLLMYRQSSRYITQKDRFLWIMPMLLMLGALAMKAQLQPPGLANAFTQEAPCELTGRITMIVNKSSGRALYLEHVTVSLYQEKYYPCEAVLAYTSDNHVYQIGNQISLKGTLQKFTKATNPGQFDEQLYYRIENIDFKVFADQIKIIDSGYSKYREGLRQWKNHLIRVYDTLLEEKEAGVLIAMLLGEKYLLDHELKELYQTGGISHILAISGLHVSLIGLGIFRLLKQCRLPLQVSTILTIAFLYSYGVLTNFSVSTNRSVVMMIVLLLAKLFGKTYDILSALALSALLILLQNPLQLFSVGFLLSYSAVLGISLLYPGFKRIFPYKCKILEGVLVSTSATLATTPAVLYFYYQFPTYGILINLLILPFITLLTITSLLAGVAGLIWLPLGTFLIGGPNYILKLYEGICRINTLLPGSLITVGRPEGVLILIDLGLLLLFIVRSKLSVKKVHLLYPVIGILLLFLPHDHKGLEVTMLDVGQGEAIYMECAGTNYLVDGGSSDIRKVGTYRLLPFLNYRGKNRIDYVIITHSDDDHQNGLMELMEEERVRIGELILPELIEKDENYIAIEKLARDKGITVSYLEEGDQLGSNRVKSDSPMDRIGDGEELSIICLHPVPNVVYPDTNSYSMVLSVSYGSFDLLLTGDLTKEEEEIICQKLVEGYYHKNYQISPATDYDVLKVAHHGSKYSTGEELLELIKPELSILSCGLDNRYGHPHQELLERLNEIKSIYYITYQEGAITLWTDGKRVTRGR